MTLSLAQLRSETLEHLGIDAVDLDSGGSANLDLLIQRSWWDICDKFHFKQKEQTTTFVTVASTRDYLLSTIVGANVFEAIRSISLLRLNDDQHIPLQAISIQRYEELYNEQASLEEQPTNYLHEGLNLRLYPTPDTVYTVTVYYDLVLSDLTGTVAIPQSWHEAILYGAVYRGHLRSRDFGAAREMEAEQQRAIAKLSSTDAKEQVNMKMAGVRVLRPGYNLKH